MTFLKTLTVLSLVTACAVPAAIAQGNVRANATSTTFSNPNPSITRNEIETFGPASRVQVSEAYYVDGLLKAGRGHMAQARASLRKAIKTDRANVAARLDYAFMVLEDDRPMQAREHIEKAQELLTECNEEEAIQCNAMQGKVAAFETLYRQAVLN